jgi:tRNA A-37 threonylcarbamoyl transferase component Bud32/DNA-directed RNA polymerase specialized sigma24 family protein
MPTDENHAAWTSLVLLDRVRKRDELAAEELFSRYFERLTSLARSRLSRRVARRTDPEDVVMSVYRSFFVGARAGRFSLRRGGDLWRLLAAMTKHKLLRQARHASAGRRSVEAEVPFEPAETGAIYRRCQPTAEDAVTLADELDWLFSELDALGRRVLELRLQGAQLSEIATDTGRAERTIRRTLAQIRELMAGRLADVDQTSESLLLSHRDFLLERMIGAGRMGKVYQAWHHAAKRAVAVKFLRKSFLDQPPVIQRFIGEARTIAKLRHPNIVGIQGLGRTPGGSYFLVMDLVAGSDLAHIQQTRPISVQEALRWATETCGAFEHAHSKGIIHCDLKPGNLLLGAGGHIVVTDFGLARSLTEQTPWTAEVEGTAPFMAPEQASRAWGPIGEHTDVYGLGAVLFTLLTGRPPWIGRRVPDILADVVSAQPVAAPTSIRPELPKPVSDICRKCLAKPPDDRYATVRELRLALLELIKSRNY